MNAPLITSTYEHELQYAYSRIERRGILFNESALAELRTRIAERSSEILKDISTAWNIDAYMGARAKRAAKNAPPSLNVASTQKLMEFLRNAGIKLPKIPPTKAQKDRGMSEHRESVNELALRKIYAATSLPEIKLLLELRELKTISSRYVEATLVDSVYLSNYDVAGTKTGRRSAREIIFGYGGNAQNWPKHSELGEKYRACAIARPGMIFVNVDQKGAEEWPVNALARNESALAEQRAGVNRHRKLAAFIFMKNVEDILKSSIEYYLGKKSRHANNYGMQPPRMSDSLAAEGYAVSVEKCAEILRRVHEYDPSVRNVFHAYVQKCISENGRMLRTPLGRERLFFGFRQNSPNYDLWNDAYSWIPQSVVGDNTGLSVRELEIGRFANALRATGAYILGDSHDSVLFECPANAESVHKVLLLAAEAFNRDIIFDSGITINIPIEADIGYSLGALKTLPDGATLEQVCEKLSSCERT